MASISANGAKGHHKFTLNVTQSATDIATNTSTLSFDFKLSPIQNSWNWELWGQSISYTITINGASYSGYIPDYDGYSVITLKSGTQSVTHNADGTKSVSFSFSVSDGTGQYYTSGNASASGSMTLSTIPRATTPTFSTKNVTMGNSLTITMSPAASTFKHKLRYNFSSLSNSVIGLSIGAEFTAQGTTTTTFTPPTSLADYIPSNTSGVCTILCYTYDANGNHIGTISTDITIAVPNYTPTAALTITGNNLLSGAYVQGKSSMSVSIAASSSYGAYISGYSSVVDGSTYNGQSFTTGALSNGSKSVVTNITDSRGKTVQVTSAAYTVYAYAAPQITSFALERQSDGTTVVATVKGTISAVNNKNAKTIQVVLNGVTNTITSSAYTISGTTTFPNVPTDVTLIGSATFTDSYTTVKRESVLPTVAVTMDFYKDGTGIAMGKVAEKSNLLDVAWEIKTGEPEKTLNNFSYRGTNLISKNADDTVQNWSEQGNLATTFYNENATEFTKPSVWGFLLNVTTGPNSAEAHQLWLEQSNGNLLHRGGNASGFGSWKIILDTTNCPDYVIEQGVVDGWEYTKWKNGKMELFGEKSLSFPALEKQTDNLYRSIVSINLSSYLTKIMGGTCSIQTNGMVPLVCRHSTNIATAEIVIVTSRTSGAFNITAPIYIIGKWK